MDDLGQARKQRSVRSTAVERKVKETEFGAAGAPPVNFPERRTEKRATEANAKEPEDKIQKIAGDEPVAHLLLNTSEKPVAGSTGAAASSSMDPTAVSSLPKPVLPATSQSGARSASPTVTRSRTPIGNRTNLSDSQLMLIELKKQSALTIGSMKTISEASIAASNAATAGNQLMAQTFATQLCQWWLVR